MIMLRSTDTIRSAWLRCAIVFSLNGATSFPWWYHVYGMRLPKPGLENGTPTSYDIRSYPNPFNPNTAIVYSLPEDGSVTRALYDSIQGGKIALVMKATEKQDITV